MAVDLVTGEAGEILREERMNLRVAVPAGLFAVEGRVGTGDQARQTKGRDVQ